MLKVGGENVSPAEVESILLQIPGVAQVAVVGYPDPRLHEVAAAFVVASPGAVVSLEAIDRHCRGEIASYKIPRRLIVVDELPMTPSGKVQKHILRAQLT
jgi:fatty-acyl-CoA synthase